MRMSTTTLAVVKQHSAPMPAATQVTLQMANGWHWQENDGTWHRFEQSRSGISSSTIDKSVASNPNGKVSFNLNGCLYIIDFHIMVQTNLMTGTQRLVMRVGPMPKRPVVSTPLWFYTSDDGCKWKPFNEYDSNLIEDRYSQNQNRTVNLNYNHGSYEIDFAKYVQKNIQTGKIRYVARIPSVTTLAYNRQVAARNDAWTWKDDNGNWQYFDSASIVSPGALSTAHYTNRSMKIWFHAQRFMYCIDFGQMTQTNMTTGKVRQIQLIAGVVSGIGVTSTSFPAIWDDMGGTNLLIVPLGSTSIEYQQVVGLFLATMPQSTVKAVKRIQNSVLYTPFYAYKLLLEKKLGAGCGVQQLFHGTKSYGVHYISKQGFDSRLHKTFHYGKGSYFARDASYSSRYTDCCTMFLAEVLVGEYTVGNSTMCRPPAKNAAGDLYDSCVDDVNNPSIFVTFDIAHSYPSYIIEY